MTVENRSKIKKLLLGILFDLMGYISYVFPPFDFVWAPLSAYLMTRLYPGRKGKIAAVISFVEEALPMIDIIPTFTLMWLYTFVFSRKKASVPVNAK
ncbi:hypothetical protein [Xanthomarina sp.]|uniref:hypothetical protein n=1 Tax=Xanthomarina sp. TaxID=1931211 RepID=UPI002BA9B4E0|nr:hypothetical protein [Xanthomarina sp.]HLV39008.1 hypothetical protein [Xanthomarina sp.]